MTTVDAPSGRDPLMRRIRSALASPGVLFSLIWQVFLIYPVMAILSADAAPGVTALGLVFVVVFSVTYTAAFASPAATEGFAFDLRDWRSTNRGGRRGRTEPRSTTGHGNRAEISGLGFLAAMTLCAVGTAPAAGANSVVAFLPFLACFVTAAWPLFWSVPLSLAFLAGGAATALWVGEPALFIPAFLVIPVALSMIGTRVSVGMSEREGALRRALGAAEERDRVGRDLHDVLGHTLTALTIRAQLANALVDSDPEATHRELTTIEGLTRTALSEMRQTVSGMRAADPELELAGFCESLGSAGTAVEISGGLDAVPDRHANLVAWTLREAGTNIIRHSGASQVTVEFSPSALRITDNGVGLDRRRGALAEHSGQGLAGLETRARREGATFTVSDAAGAGTVVEVSWP